MRDCWFSDRRDLVKWGTCVSVAREVDAAVILQVACLRPDEVGVELSDGSKLPTAVQRFFRDVRRAEDLSTLLGPLEVRVFDEEFVDREEYWSAALGAIAAERLRKVVLLDPDAGLAPASATDLRHILPDEVAAVFDVLDEGDALVVHQQARRTRDWMGEARLEVAAALELPIEAVSVVSRATRRRGAMTKTDVAFLVARKPGDGGSTQSAPRGEVDPRPEAQELFAAIRAALPSLRELLRTVSSHRAYEDPIYRFYHQSWKVYHLQVWTAEIVAALAALCPRRPLNEWFAHIVARGTGKEYVPDHNRRWLEETGPIVEAFFHARYFLDMVCRYGGELEAPPNHWIPSGWAAVLYLYNLR